jgi:hypothetical protein
VTVPLIVAVNACDWADRRVPPKNMPKANITIVATVCDRVARVNCIGCASLKKDFPLLNGCAFEPGKWFVLKAMITLEREGHSCLGESRIVY